MSGSIITFYSFKGGAGRSMALANTAWMLASNGFRVLTIDWDLEAPGLPRFFQPFLDDHLLASSDGVIELFAAQVERSSVAGRAVPSIDQYLTPSERPDLSKYVIPLQWKFSSGGRIDLLIAGKPGPAYARYVTQFDWRKLYERCGGRDFVEDLKVHLRATYDYVLVDSRTGINDTAGICTVQMPDILVVCFTLNRQSIEGSARVAESVDAQRRLHGIDEGFRIFPVPMRVENAEKEKLESARHFIASKFTRFLGHLPADKISKYWSDVEVLAEPFYAYEEILCAFGDTPGNPVSMLASVERITQYLTNGRTIAATPIDDHTRKRVLAAFAQTVPERPRESSCFISYSSKDATFAEQLYIDLENAGVRCWFAPHDLPIGAKIRPGIDKAISENDRVVLILSSNAISSAWVEKEVETSFEREAMTGRTILLPVRLDGAIMQVEEGWAADVRRQRNIGDFTSWRDKLSYTAALSRLLDALNT